MSQPELFNAKQFEAMRADLAPMGRALFAPARNSDPITSHAAADEARELIAKHQRLILSALRQGPAGVDGIAARCSLTGHQAGKRVTDMQRLGLIELTGRLVKSTSGRSQREWRAVA